MRASGTGLILADTYCDRLNDKRTPGVKANSPEASWLETKMVLCHLDAERISLPLDPHDRDTPRLSFFLFFILFLYAPGQTLVLKRRPYYGLRRLTRLYGRVDVFSAMLRNREVDEILVRARIDGL